MDKNIFNIAVIGAGKVAHSIVPALLDNSFNIDLVIDIDYLKVDTLAKKFNIKNYGDSYGLLDKSHNLILICVHDDSIHKLSIELAGLAVNLENKTFIHFSGSKTIDELKEIREKGARVASLHPMQTFPSYDKVNLYDTYCAVEADTDETRQVVFSIAKNIGMQPFPIQSEAKVYYHLMGVFASNFLVANYKLAEICREYAGADIPPAHILLESLTKQTLQNIKEKGIVKALSGPVERGDTETIKNHLNELSNDILLKKYYQLETSTLLEIALNKGSINQEKYDEIKQLLE